MKLHLNHAGTIIGIEGDEFFEVQEYSSELEIEEIPEEVSNTPYEWMYINNNFISCAEYAKSIEWKQPLFEQIGFYKSCLLETDYVVTKMSEAFMAGKDIRELQNKYSEIIQNRNFWREEINRLEGELN